MHFIPKVKFTPTIKQIETIAPRVVITAEALAKMKIYIQECADEVGWFFTAFKIEEKNSTPTYLIGDAFLFKQQVHATTTEVNPEKLSEFAEEILALENGIEIWNSIKGWGHSHVNMGITPSPQDDTQMNFFKNSGHDYFIRIIGNKKGDFKIDVYDYTVGVAYIDVEWREKIPEALASKELEIQKIIHDANKKIDGLRKQIDAKRTEMEETMTMIIKEEIKQKVSKFAVYSTYSTPRSAYNKYDDFDKAQMAMSDTHEKKTLDTEKEKSQTEETKRPNQKINTMTDLLDWFTPHEISLFSAMPTLASVKNCMPTRHKDTSFTENDFNKIWALSMTYIYGED